MKHGSTIIAGLLFIFLSLGMEINLHAEKYDGVELHLTLWRGGNHKERYPEVYRVPSALQKETGRSERPVPDFTFTVQFIGWHHFPDKHGGRGTSHRYIDGKFYDIIEYGFVKKDGEPPPSDRFGLREVIGRIVFNSKKEASPHMIWEELVVPVRLVGMPEGTVLVSEDGERIRPEELPVELSEENYTIVEVSSVVDIQKKADQDEDSAEHCLESGP